MKPIVKEYQEPIVAFTTEYGVSIQGRSEAVFEAPLAQEYLHNVDLIFTSPPFPLSRKKKYGNRQGEEYIDWLASFAPLFRRLLSPTGSIVIEIGNSWEPGHPVMSTLALKALLAFLEAGEFHLCQQFIWYNPAKLPSPAQWVNIERIRVKDAYTHLWWMAVTERPKADNRRVLKPYSEAMKKLLERQNYNSGKRPSEHDIGSESFLQDNKGAIPPNVLFPSNILTYANTRASTDYLNYCREKDIEPHPARMPAEVAEFFIRFLTEEGDLVLDPFAGSNTTGAKAEELRRRWIAIEPQREYIEGSIGRFDSNCSLFS